MVFSVLGAGTERKRRIAEKNYAQLLSDRKAKMMPKEQKPLFCPKMVSEGQFLTPFLMPNSLSLPGALVVNH